MFVQIQLRGELADGLAAEGDAQSSDYIRGSKLDADIHRCMIDCLKVGISVSFC
jgi:hypothetical protein